MRDRIKTMRRQLVDKSAHNAPISISVMLSNSAACSRIPLDQGTCAQTTRGILNHALDSGRICVAALNSKNIDYVANAIAKVLVQV